MNKMMKKQFTHFRFYNRATGELQTHGGATVCYIPHEEQEGCHEHYQLGFSFCSPKDNFNHKRGCRISEGRAGEVIGADGLLTYDEFVAFAQNMVASTIIRHWGHGHTGRFLKSNELKHPVKSKKE